jgi:hypothetical protein
MPLNSYWMKEPGLPTFPKLSQDLRVDVVVVGAGITGITAAYLLKKAGKTMDRWSKYGMGCRSWAKPPSTNSWPRRLPATA